jgi:hypothetical protein
VLPLGRGKGVDVSTLALSSDAGKKESRVDSDGKGRDTIDGFGRAHLGLADADDLFLVAMVDLDVPPPEVILDDLLQREIRIGTDKVCGVSIRQTLIAGRSIVERFDCYELEVHVGAGLAPQHGADLFCVKGVDSTGGKGLDGSPWNLVIEMDLPRCW